ncbi:DUF1214 domain-containing protein [Corynebacterium hylobatis]|uniref:DUF1214 domain-containing protein n=1 Tax=Corynebacterium hylobatis TaxID=1859290 RepID=A0A3S0BIE6_9CORY|nr:DUF1214 domain-containing protein [Corynebacterium hylobatis]RSZ66118.1 DUF1214 domain-containing protein [Corynebacterium hylobatis]
MSIHVNADNFVRAETDRMIHDLSRDAGGVNLFLHNREPAAIDRQTVVRLNRDTLYSFAVVDISAGATLTLPESGERYLSAMVVNQDHFINAIYHDAGDYELTTELFDSPYVVIAVRILADPADPTDIAEVTALQDQISLNARSATPFTYPDYDAKSFDATRDALLALAAEMSGFEGMFGRKDMVDPVRHLIGTAAGWGGLPSNEASYVGVNPAVAGGRYELTFVDVPVDGFWSVSVYNQAGYFEPNTADSYTVNNITATPNADGSVTVRFGDFPEGTPNTILTPEGWNFLIRLYRPRQEILDGAWKIPVLTPAG